MCSPCQICFNAWPQTRLRKKKLNSIWSRRHKLYLNVQFWIPISERTPRNKNKTCCNKVTILCYVVPNSKFKVTKEQNKKKSYLCSGLSSNDRCGEHLYTNRGELTWMSVGHEWSIYLFVYALNWNVSTKARNRLFVVNV